jgi:hypothetical protein
MKDSKLILLTTGVFTRGEKTNQIIFFYSGSRISPKQIISGKKNCSCISTLGLRTSEFKAINNSYARTSTGTLSTYSHGTVSIVIGDLQCSLLDPKLFLIKKITTAVKRQTESITGQKQNEHFTQAKKLILLKGLHLR